MSKRKPNPRFFATPQEEEEFHSLNMNDKADYYIRRNKGVSHRLAMMLVTRKGPAGFVK